MNEKRLKEYEDKLLHTEQKTKSSLSVSRVLFILCFLLTVFQIWILSRIDLEEDGFKIIFNSILKYLGWLLFLGLLFQLYKNKIKHIETIKNYREKIPNQSSEPTSLNASD